MIFTRTLLFIFIGLLALPLSADAAPPQREFYEIRVYHFKNKAQEDRLDTYLKNAYLPALHRAGIRKVGVFKPAVDSLAGKRLYVLIPFQSMDQFAGLPRQLQADNQYASTGSDYVNAAHDNPPYDRMESIILQAFTDMPQMQTPKLSTPASERIYELRSYEGATEKLYQKKVQMFNQGGEIGIFKNLGFNAVFYAEVISGSRMPNLIYMTTFADMASRDQHWEAFKNDPAWKKLSAMDEYKNTVSKSDIFLLHPTDYSDI